MRFGSDGSDRSWLASDTSGHVGWFVANGGGLLPDLDAGLLEAAEDHLSAWIRALGLPFEHGQGGADGLEQWRSAASAGIYAYDHHARSGGYRRVCAPASPIKLADLPDGVTSHVVDLRPIGLNFSSRTVVTSTDLGHLATD